MLNPGKLNPNQYLPLFPSLSPLSYSNPLSLSFSVTLSFFLSLSLSLHTHTHSVSPSLLSLYFPLFSPSFSLPLSFSSLQSLLMSLSHLSYSISLLLPFLMLCFSSFYYLKLPSKLILVSNALLATSIFKN